MSIVYHGSHNDLMGTNTPHEGMCFTDSLTSAEAYGDTIYELDLSNLEIIECEGYDRNENYAPADSEDFRAKYQGQCDVLEYEDEDENGRAHTCYRIISERAIARVSAS